MDYLEIFHRPAAAHSISEVIQAKTKQNLQCGYPPAVAEKNEHLSSHIPKIYSRILLCFCVGAFKAIAYQKLSLKDGKIASKLTLNLIHFIVTNFI